MRNYTWSFDAPTEIKEPSQGCTGNAIGTGQPCQLLDKTEFAAATDAYLKWRTELPTTHLPGMSTTSDCLNMSPFLKGVSFRVKLQDGPGLVLCKRTLGFVTGEQSFRLPQTYLFHRYSEGPLRFPLSGSLGSRNWHASRFACARRSQAQG